MHAHLICVIQSAHGWRDLSLLSFAKCMKAPSTPHADQAQTLTGCICTVCINNRSREDVLSRIRIVIESGKPFHAGLIPVRNQALICKYISLWHGNFPNTSASICVDSNHKCRGALWKCINNFHSNILTVKIRKSITAPMCEGFLRSNHDGTVVCSLSFLPERQGADYLRSYLLHNGLLPPPTADRWRI